MSVIWVIRHGQASFGASEYDRLSDTGIRQSEITGRFLRKSGIRFHSVYTGTMKRQIDTAENALKLMKSKTEPVICSEFDEYDFTAIIKSQLPGLIEEDPDVADDLQGIFNDNESFQRFFGKIMKRWISGKFDAAGVETYSDYKKRVKDGLFRIGEENGREKNIAIFTSGGVVSIAMQLALELSDHESMRLGWRIMNASISKFKFSRERLNLLMFNQMSHLEYENEASLLTYR